MDYIFASLIKLKNLRVWLFLIYDIMCIWKLHLLERLKNLPPDVRLHLILAMLSFGIPKMHIHGHKFWCRLLYSLNLLLGSAQVEGEGIERVWSGIGAVASSTRDMGPGSWHDTLDCQLSSWNWEKLVGIGTLFLLLFVSIANIRMSSVAMLRRRLDRAEVELPQQKEALEEFSAQQADRVPEWTGMVLAFELDNTKPNPYEVKIKGMMIYYGG
jgi:hypothetical protein